MLLKAFLMDIFMQNVILPNVILQNVMEPCKDLHLEKAGPF
jgi:hypothetical protein